MTVVAAILVFCLLIISHEFGHLIMAKLNGVFVYDFSLGMGPKLFSIKGKETTYSLRVFPIGGHCLMMGEDEESDDERSFGKKKVGQRILVILGGPVANFLTAVLLFIIIYTIIGATFTSSEVAGLIEGQAAEAAGVLPGDVIIEVNGQPVINGDDISPALALGLPDQPAEVVVKRDGTDLNLTIQPYFDTEGERFMIGIYMGTKTVKQNLFTAIGLGFKNSMWFSKEILLVLVNIVTGKEKPDVTGPVGVISIISEATHYGIQALLLISAILCVNLAVVNLLPLPALDGSRIIFLLVEGLRGKPINPEREGMVHFIGLMLLFALMIVITFNDIARLVGG